MLPNNSNLNIGKTAGYKNKIIGNKKKGSNRNINKVLVYHQKSTQSGSPPTQSKTSATLEVHSIRCSEKSINVTAEKNNGENWVDCLQFFVKTKMEGILMTTLGARINVGDLAENNYAFT